MPWFEFGWSDVLVVLNLVEYGYNLDMEHVVSPLSLKVVICEVASTHLAASIHEPGQLRLIGWMTADESIVRGER